MEYRDCEVRVYNEEGVLLRKYVIPNRFDDVYVIRFGAEHEFDKSLLDGFVNQIKNYKKLYTIDLHFYITDEFKEGNIGILQAIIHVGDRDIKIPYIYPITESYFKKLQAKV